MKSEWLTNGGFETGTLEGWTEAISTSHVVESSAASPACAAPAPNEPRSGAYALYDRRRRCHGRQTLDISSCSGELAGGGLVLRAFAFASTGCNELESDDTITLIAEFRSAADGGTLLDSVASDVLDPNPGAYRELSLETAVPPGTQTIVFKTHALLDDGFSSIDLLIDDASLRLGAP